MDAPKLEVNKCSVLIADNQTGHVFKKNLTVFLNGENESDVFQIFDNFTDAKEFVMQFVHSNPEFECCIFDYFGEHLFTYDRNGERKYKDAD
jgi:hypothetical protein